jgi:hypothetical protein
MTQKEQLRRIYEVDYLSSSLEWTDNPERTLALQATEEIIMAPYPRSEDLKLLRTIAVEKLELYHSLVRSDPKRARLLYQRSKGTRLEKLLFDPHQTKAKDESR